MKESRRKKVVIINERPDPNNAPKPEPKPTMQEEKYPHPGKCSQEHKEMMNAPTTQICKRKKN